MADIRKAFKKSKVNKSDVIDYLTSLSSVQKDNIEREVARKNDQKSWDGIKEASPDIKKTIAALTEEYDTLSGDFCKFKHEIEFKVKLLISGSATWYSDGEACQIDWEYCRAQVLGDYSSQLKRAVKNGLDNLIDDAEYPEELIPETGLMIDAFDSRITKFLKDRRSLAKQMKISEEHLMVQIRGKGV